MDPTAPNEVPRTCPYCAESIRAAAKLCPHCRQWLTWRSLRNPMVNATVMGTGMLVMFFIFSYTAFTALGRMFNAPPYYEDHPDALALVTSGLNWAQTKDGPRIYVTGILTNRSAFAWRDVEFECRFYDRAGKMIDAAGPRSYLTIRTNDDAAFRATVNPSAPTNEYDHFTLTVTHARNLRALF